MDPPSNQVDAGDARAAFALLWQADSQLGAWGLAEAVVVRASPRTGSDEDDPLLPLHLLSCHPLPPAAAWIDTCAPGRDAHAASLVATLCAMPSGARHAWARQLLPAAVADGAWLARASAAVRSHEETSACLVRAWRRRHEGSEGHFVPRPLAALRRLGLVQASDPPASLARDDAIDDAMFDWPVLGMALGRYPVRYADEILGFHLAATLLGGDPVDRGEFGDGPVIDDVDDIDIALQAIERSGASRVRVARGARIATRAWRDRRAALLALARGERLGAQGRMQALLKRVGAVAAHYHRGRRLGDASLESLFLQAADDPAPLLERLAHSSFVRPGDAAHSPLLASLAAPGGAMAGVFDEDDRAIIAAWIDSLLEDAPTTGVPRGAAGIASTEAPAPVAAAVPSVDPASLPLRAFHQVMLNVDRHPEVLPHAARFASAWLARAGAGLERGEDALPFSPWDARAFDAWLARRHAAQVAEGDAPVATPSRELLVDACVQLAPLVLVDGAWLQHWGAPGACATAVGRRLWRIHLDEVGDGDVRANHPNLFRALLAAMGVDVPALGSDAFRDWALLRDASFHVPLFWLCLSMFPSRFLPETLGLTLAVELAGVGGGYRQSRAALRAHGFPTTFVDVHDTVDNVAIGHSALAAEAIRLHLDDVLATGGPDEVQRHWRRVWTGWRARIAPEGLA